MKNFPLGKVNKLCSVTAIDALFGDRSASSALAYPLRAVWRVTPRPEGMADTPKFLISIPKKRLHHAVDRVTMRRRVREAYRLNHLQAEAAAGSDAARPLDIAFIYVADRLTSYRSVSAAMVRLLTAIHPPSHRIADETPQSDK